MQSLALAATDEAVLHYFLAASRKSRTERLKQKDPELMSVLSRVFRQVFQTEKRPEWQELLLLVLDSDPTLVADSAASCAAYLLREPCDVASTLKALFPLLKSGREWTGNKELVARLFAFGEARLGSRVLEHEFLGANLLACLSVYAEPAVLRPTDLFAGTDQMDGVTARLYRLASQSPTARVFVYYGVLHSPLRLEPAELVDFFNEIMAHALAHPEAVVQR
ncbi:hypothetical protein HDU91_003060, partial [Kappamyces sp. JEL0680]